MWRRGRHGDGHTNRHRSVLGDNRAHAKDFRIGFDAVNTLVMHLLVEEIRGGLVDEFQVETGIEPVERPDLSPYGSIVFSTPRLMGDLEQIDAPYVFVGPSISSRPDATPFPWEELR